MRKAADILYSIGAISAYEVDALRINAGRYAKESLGPNPTQAEIIAAQKETKFNWSKLIEMLKGSEDYKDVYKLLSIAWETNDDTEGEKLNAILKKVDTQQDAIHEAIEHSNQKRRERDLLDRAAAEGTRLRIMFGLDNGLDDAVEIVQDISDTVASML